MKFLIEYLPRAEDPNLPIELQFELAKTEFGHLGAAVNRVPLDPHFVTPGVDSPYAVRPYSDDALVVEIASLEVLVRYVADTGRTINLMAASAWETMNRGELLTHRLYIFHNGFGDREDLEAPGGCD